MNASQEKLCREAWIKFADRFDQFSSEWQDKGADEMYAAGFSDGISAAQSGEELFDEIVGRFRDEVRYPDSLHTDAPTAPATVAQSVPYLENGLRCKVHSRGIDGGAILGLPESMVGQWVAFVDATDNKHLLATPAPSVAKE